MINVDHQSRPYVKLSRFTLVLLYINLPLIATGNIPRYSNDLKLSYFANINMLLREMADLIMGTIYYLHYTTITRIGTYYTREINRTINEL